MKYQTEHVNELAQSQHLMSELFQFIGEHEDANKQLRPTWQFFVQAWAGENPLVRIKVMTARDDNGNIQGCVMALLTANPLFIARPTVQCIVNLTQGDQAFEDYVKIVLDAV